MNNKILVLLFVVAAIFLSGCIQSEPEVKYVYVTPNPTPEISYVYSTPTPALKETACISGSNYDTNEYVSDICGIGSNLRFNAHDVTIRGSGSNFIIGSDVSRITIYATGSNIRYPRNSNPIIIDYGSGNNVVKN